MFLFFPCNHCHLFLLSEFCPLLVLVENVNITHESQFVSHCCSIKHVFNTSVSMFISICNILPFFVASKYQYSLCFRHEFFNQPVTPLNVKNSLMTKMYHVLSNLIPNLLRFKKESDWGSGLGSLYFDHKEFETPCNSYSYNRSVANKLFN